MTNFKDHFSRDSTAYAEYRPRYPADLFTWLASVSPVGALVWDVGTGNGQAAVALAEHFVRVIATDPSPKQIEAAVAHPRVEYRVAGEAAGLQAHSADLITVAQALHWFDRPKFWAEVKRVLRPGGVIAVWCYELQQVSPDIDRIVNRFYHETVGPYWTPDRKLVEDGYRSVEFPFEEFTVPEFAMTAEWTLEQQVGYLGTWSAVGRYRKERGADPVALVQPELEAVWPPNESRRVSWPLSVRAGRA
jgi:ubiquinone/menaquinone biosynthesis C-methylase UbiE